jgi:hypothetical protein
MKRPAVPLAIAAAVVLAATALPTTGEAQGFNRLQHCSNGSFTLRFAATYTEEGQGKNAVKQLDVDLEADRKSGFKSGQKVSFFVDGKQVGAANFKADRNGDLDAELKLRSTSGKSFPTVKDGSKVSAEIRNVSVATCKL